MTKFLALLTAAILLTVTLGGCFPDPSVTRAANAAATQAQAQAKAAATMASLAKKAAKPTSADKLNKLLRKMKSGLDKASGKAAKGRNADGEKRGLKDDLGTLRATDRAILREFESTEKKLRKIKAKTALKRHEVFVTHYKKKIATLRSGLTEVIRDKDNRELSKDSKSTSTFIKANLPKEKHQPLGAALPHRNVDYQAPAPTLGANIAPAYLAQTSALEPSTLPRTPTAADLASTVDTSQTAAIRDLANKLDKDPVKIYEFVRNNIVYEPYYGSRKGAQETLWEKGGNDVDQANLLIALYRYSGISSRYVTEVVEVPVDAAMNWVGVEKEDVAAKVFSSAGIPSTAIISGGKISAIQMDHTWVEAYVNYEDYRGVGSGDGEKSWAPLDASFKQYEYKKPVDLKTAVPFDAEGLVNELTTSATIDPVLGSFTSVDTATVTARFQAYQDEVKNYVENDIPGDKFTALIGEKRILSESPGLLPNSLPTKVVGVTGERNALPDAMRSKVLISAPGLSYTAPLSEVAGKSVTVSYVGATAADKQVLSQYQGISEVPAYLVSMLPVLEIDGHIVAVGTTPTNLGSDHYLDINLDPVGEPVQRITNSLTAGSYYSVTLNLGGMTTEAVSASGDRLKRGAAALKVISERGTPADGFAADDYIGEMLHLAGTTYFSQLDLVNDVSARASNIVYQRRPSEAMTGLETSTSSLFGTPLAIDLDGLFFDVDADNTFAVAKDGDEQKVKDFFTVSGVTSSQLEGTTYATLLGSQAEGVSTMALLRQANSEGIPIYAINADNIVAVMSRLTVSSSIKNDIRNSVAAGLTVTIPERNLVTAYGWQGVGYIISDPDSGSAGYMISGGTAGGSQPFEGLMTGSNIAAFAMNVVLDGILIVASQQTADAVAAWFPAITPNIVDAIPLVQFAVIGLTFATAASALANNTQLTQSQRDELWTILIITTTIVIGVLTGLMVASIASSATAPISLVLAHALTTVYSMVFGLAWQGIVDTYARRTPVQ